MAARRKPTQDQRVAEYVDRPRMTQRVRHKKLIVARIFGNYGVYRAQAKLTKKVDGECTCPSEWWPCKHVQALRKTWDVNPESFFDLDQFLAELSQWSKASLVEAIGHTVIQWPQCLCMFGVPGFDDEEEDDDDYWEDGAWDE